MAAVGFEAVFSVAFLGFLVLSNCGPDDGGRHHADEMCPRCRITRDPKTAITRWRTVLRFCHTGWWFGLWTAATVVLLIAFVLAGTDFSQIQRLLFCGYVVMRASMLAVDALVHAPLIPWCPWCRTDGEGGWFANDPDPDPALRNAMPTEDEPAPVGAAS